MPDDIVAYSQAQTPEDQAICELLSSELSRGLPGAISKVWHAHPVWFLDDNPIAGYSKQKLGIRLMFWSGADFDEPKLEQPAGRFKDASVFYNSVDEIDTEDLQRWFKKSQDIQWDYKNIVKNKGILRRLK